MKNLLLLNASLQGDRGNSSKLAAQFVEKWQEGEAIHVVKVDLNDLNLPHLSAQEMQTWSMVSDNMSPEQVKLAAYSNDLLAQLERSDAIVIGMPMYNFTVPTTFKAWIDRIARAGRTFSYTSEGPKGHLVGKTVYVMAARGGIYQGTENDTQTPYLRLVLGLLGITDVHFVYLEGLNMGDEFAQNSWQQAREEINELLPAIA
ncbi:NAD(P)H-dependent oxidoreductase [uncultured Paraglaciecola sp.]|uniref:FMN-dependent NADH-azoreductase n=1 Tax=uncultured Paraglaciecola sp. TaxID=1765024 RepID=UPI0030D80AB3|tara:strand:+ start:1618 stop:2226 length:609 start_codon:yes stop_codon:yes gene_type:complete